jgi:glycosyltransferase involved in cell wall biosynthesis
LKKVSIITTTYNSEKTIKDTLESVVAQTYSNIEHIIIDGGSRDNTLQIIQDYKHVALVISEKDNGIYDAMNKGINKASGEIIGILNSDDFYCNNNVIQKVVTCMDNKNTDGAYANLNFVDQYNINKITRKWKSGNYSIRSFWFGWMPPHPTVFVKKEVYQKIGTFSNLLNSAADYEFMLRAFVKYKFSFSYLNETIVHMRNGGLSTSSLKNRLKANNEDRKAWDLNNLKPYFFTLYLKPIRKIFQFIK